ncbi:MAG: 5-(carboxyamino)imidazole ribonucleotide synthase [Burkholderiales bacterium]
MILPGATLGLLGGGQLGRMFVAAARSMGYHVLVLDPDPEAPAEHFADEHICADFRDATALKQLTQRCAAITTEFENAPADSLIELAEHCVVRPRGECVAIAQDRITEKTFLRDHGFAVGPFNLIRTEADTHNQLNNISFPALLKTSRMGYDGKGQERVDSIDQLREVYRQLQYVPCVLEKFLPLKCEISVVLARGADGTVAAFPVAENRHAGGILDISIVPARVSDSIKQQATDAAIRLAEELNYVGVLAVEFFVLHDDTLLINEIAPRPHNSGHYTLDACMTSQFEQQVRALCGLPLGDTRQHSPAVMVNLLGDVWRNGKLPSEKILRHHNVKLHLYGKRYARPGRKMGHFTVLAGDLDTALMLASEIKSNLSANQFNFQPSR